MLLNLIQQGGNCGGLVCDMSGNGLDNSKKLIEEFAKAGRTGRRNALANVLGSHAECGTGELTTALQQLQTSEPNGSATQEGSETQAKK